MATRKCLGIDEPWSSTLSEMILYTEKDIPKEVFFGTNQLLSLLVIESKDIEIEKEDILKEELTTKLQTRINALGEMHDFHGRICPQKRKLNSIISSDDSVDQSGKDFMSSDEEGEGYFYYEDGQLPIPYNLDEKDLSFIEESLQQQMMNGNMPLCPIRSASVGSEGKLTIREQISSFLGGNTKGSTSGKENLEDLNY